MAATPVSGCGECLGDRPRGDFVRCAPKVAPEFEFRECTLVFAAKEPGVLGLFGAVKGPVWVGVMARVEAAMMMLVLEVCARQ